LNHVTFGPASWIGLIGAVAAALAPVFGELPTTWGAVIAAALAGVTVMGRQLQAITNTQYAEPTVVEFGDLIDELPLEATDATEGVA
jgi:NhaP-type Na+/H+ or K+/H+ antiporter